MATKEVFFYAKKVHTTTLSLAATSGFAIQFGHATFSSNALGNG
jgi:hypothetical protein